MTNTRRGTRRGKKKKKKKVKVAPELVQQMASVKAALDKAPLDVKTLSNQCLLLSKVLDSLVELNQKPIYRHDLLPLVQQVCNYKEKAEVLPALMVLLLSIKSAFRAGWLSTLEVSGKDEIFSTLNLLFDSFTTSHEDVAPDSLQCGGSAVTEPLEAMSFLVSISDRFYPRLQLNAVFVAVPAKVGYEVLMCDFHVPHMNMEDRVRLYVTQTDSTENSTCLITPPQVNILVNGRQVEKRVITGYMDAGPQMPSDVNHLVNVGANVLQVIGEFSGPYIIAVASSTTIERSASNTHLEEYVAPKRTEVNPTTPDDEVVEGASRLSLRCPISHQRLVTPVKATTCRHLQCFEYDSFLAINEKRPSWRCPCCNRFTSWPDLRIDRKMEKILKETDESIHEVIISQDGCWALVPTDGNHTPDVEGVTDLSKVADDHEFHETKPDKQTLLEIQENIPDITATGPPNLHDFAGPSWGGSTRNGANFTGGGSTSQRNNSRTGFHSNSRVGGHETCVQLQPGFVSVSVQTQQQGPPRQLATQIQGLQPSQQGASFRQVPVLHQTPTLQEQNSWRPGAIRMRGRIANPSPNSSANPLHQRCAFNTGPNYRDSDANAA